MTLNNVLYADDYAAPEAAVAAANTLVGGGAQGASVVFGGGVYTTNGIDVDGRIALVGQGEDLTIIKLANSQNREVVRGANFRTLTGTAIASPETRGDNNIQIRNLTIDGNNANNSGANCRGVAIWGRALVFDGL